MKFCNMGLKLMLLLMLLLYLPSHMTCDRSAHARSSALSLALFAIAAAIGGATATAAIILSVSSLTTRSMLCAARSRSFMLKDSISVPVVATHVKGHFMRPPFAAFFSISQPVNTRVTAL